MTTTMSPATSDPRPAPAPIPTEVLAAIDAYRDAAASLKETAASLDGGARRRVLKLSAQMLAASRLLANAPRRENAPVATAAFLARRASGCGDDVGVVDATIQAASRALRALHAWRGHTASLPEADRP